MVLIAFQTFPHLHHLAHPSHTHRYNKLIELVLEPGLVIVGALAEVADGDVIDDLVQVLVNIFDAQNALVPLVYRSAVWEVAQCLSSQTLFRRNSIATKLSTVCARMYGQVRAIGATIPLLCPMVGSSPWSLP
jgi:hypothetical protein